MDANLEKNINLHAEEFLSSESNSYVVFNSKAEKLYENDLPHCYAFVSIHGPSMQCTIYSKEAYEKMIAITKEK